MNKDINEFADDLHTLWRTLLLLNPSLDNMVVESISQGPMTLDEAIKGGIDLCHRRGVMKNDG